MRKINIREDKLPGEDGRDLVGRAGTRAIPHGRITASKIVEAAVIPVSIAIIAISIGIVLTFTYSRDQAFFAVAAREILDGKVPYKDIFDIKTPGIFLVYTLAQALFGPTETGIRILEALAMVATTIGLVRLSRIHFRDARIGFVAAALATQIHAQFESWGTAEPETFGGTLTILGLLAATGATGIHKQKPVGAFTRCSLWILTGILFGIAGLMKPPLAGGGVVVAIAGALVVFSGRDRNLRPSTSIYCILEPFIATAIGGALPFLMVFEWLYLKGALNDFYQALFEFAPGYTKLNWERASIPGQFYYGINQWLFGYSSALFGGIIALLIVRPLKRELPFLLTVGGIIAVQIAGVVMQGKFFPYHWGATFPLTAIIAASGWMKFARASAKKGTIYALAAFAVFEVVAMMHAPIPYLDSTFLSRTFKRIELYVISPKNQVDQDVFNSACGSNVANNRAVSDYISAHSNAKRPIFVWGFEPGIYILTKRPIASRFIIDLPQRSTWAKSPMQEALMNDLEKSRPEFIIVQHNDVFDAITGNSLDSAQSIAEFPAFHTLLDQQYKAPVTIGYLDIYTSN